MFTTIFNITKTTDYFIVVSLHEGIFKINRGVVGTLHPTSPVNFYSFDLDVMNKCRYDVSFILL